MGNMYPFIETLSEARQNKRFTEALQYANSTSEQTLARTSDVPRCIYFGFPAEMYEALESEVRKNKLLNKTLKDKDELINKRLVVTQELEQRLEKEQRQHRNQRRRYENERAYNRCLTDKLSKARLETLSVEAQASKEIEELRVAVAGDLYKHTATIKDLEGQIRHYKATLTEVHRLHKATLTEADHQHKAILTEIASRLRESKFKTSTQPPARNIKHKTRQPPHPHNKPPARSYQTSPTLQTTPTETEPSTTTTHHPTRSILKHTLPHNPTPTKHKCPHTVYLLESDCYPKPSSPSFRARVKDQISNEQASLARLAKHKVWCAELSDEIDRSEQETSEQETSEEELESEEDEDERQRQRHEEEMSRFVREHVSRIMTMKRGQCEGQVFQGLQRKEWES